MAESRKAIHAYLSPPAHDCWHDVAEDNGVSVSALLESIAQQWTVRRKRGEPLLPDEAEVVLSARRIDAERRRRRRA